MNTADWISADQQYCWHPFTRQDEWVKGEPADPLVLVEGDGSWLVDSEGRRYIDANASIWTNVHGHCHPVINAAIIDQLGKVAHTSALCAQCAHDVLVCVLHVNGWVGVCRHGA